MDTDNHKNNSQMDLQKIAELMDSLLTSDCSFEDTKVSIWLSMNHELNFMTSGYHKWIDNQNEFDFKTAVVKYLSN
ncbi:hypothetical protein [Lentilactobacillus kosonis]|uniref:Uncharacterized protein n=1 Tax=Lentilactobacillus kosonis TaxID=2810561 RepID=A0A401FPP2_9LACO|nr:hypothetical protein [Lentilactobacillus kosonis]GAY74307.1 hypothetical protein NBRC111893_2453 [Lentilactobacillus kosonis]